MISVQKLTKKFGDHLVLDEVSLEVNRGETVVLLGPSGSGKTTLLRCIAGLEPFDDGQIEVDGIEVRPGMTPSELAHRFHEIRLRCGFLFQQLHLFPHLTVLENLTLAPIHVKKLPPSEAAELAEHLLEKLGLHGKARMHPNKLSGGEQQRVAIARALAMEPNYLLYDEPTSSLDPDRARDIWQIMSQLAAQGQAQLVVTHQRELTQAIPCRVVRIEHGRLSAA
ncbi:MAG: amino acid ABC transporter ATP-binding protein [Candidatus Sumerlaea chitinivorans]|nr:amino acid ABC transporter ATP-binding protein [Candidatus Sumerlaea chitinivorans]